MTRLIAVAVVLAAALVLPRLSRTPAPPGPPHATDAAGHSTAPGTHAPEAALARAFGPEVGFRSRERLVEHFRKHGAEFGCRDAADYLRRAQALRDRPAGGGVLEVVRADGVITRFDRASGAFLAFADDGTIRTFFRPNDGEAYFRRQAERERR
jgi:hypothetical protein